MSIQEIKGRGIEQLQQQHRKRIVRCMFWFEVSFFLIDLAFFFYYYMTGDNVNEVTPQNYLPRWVIFPAVVNTVFLFLAYNVRRQIVVGVNRRLFSVKMPTRLHFFYGDCIFSAG